MIVFLPHFLVSKKWTLHFFFERHLDRSVQPCTVHRGDAMNTTPIGERGCGKPAARGNFTTYLCVLRCVWCVVWHPSILWGDVKMTWQTKTMVRCGITLTGPNKLTYSWWLCFLYKDLMKVDRKCAYIVTQATKSVPVIFFSPYDVFVPLPFSAKETDELATFFGAG